MRHGIRWVLSSLVLIGSAAGAQAADTLLLAAPAAATQALVQHVLATADHGQRPFAVVDKQAATISVFRADGQLAGLSSVLLGRTPGDLAVPGTGERAQNGALRADDLTTPAGRFVSAPGRNSSGEAVVWIDYANALAIHRLRPAPTAQRRAERLASPDPRDKRISAGCVVVPVDFYESIVQPVLGSGTAVVYVMPENNRHWSALWPAAASAGAVAKAGVGTPIATLMASP